MRSAPDERKARQPGYQCPQGLHPRRSWLFYATGGLTWSQARFLEDAGLTGNGDKVLRMRAGWALGAGAEVAIASGWTARLEYLYYQLGKAGGAFPSGTRYESTA